MRSSVLSAAAVLLLSMCFAMVSAANVNLVVSSGSNANWIAVQVIGTGVTTNSVEIKEATDSQYTLMTYDTTTNAGYWTYNDWSKADGFDLPLSFRLTGTNGGVIVMSGVVDDFPGAIQTIDSGYTFTTPTRPPKVTPTTTTTTTRAPTTTKAPKVTTTKAPAPAKVTTAPTAAPVAASANIAQSACTTSTKMLVPLYVYPGAAWDTVIAGASLVKTVAVVNPNSGPGGAPNADYVTYMNKMHAAGVDLVGYVHTSYGTRAIADVLADINIYATTWPLVSGIFLDEAASDAANLPYYITLYNYIMNLPGYTYDIINPGTAPIAGYMNAATQILSLEDYGSNVPSTLVPSYGSCNNKQNFVAVVHTTSSSNMQSVINGILSKKYFGYVYVTDGAGGCCTYNQLCTYYSTMASYIASKKY